MLGQQLTLGLADTANDKSGNYTQLSPRPRRVGWGEFLARVFIV